MHHDLRLASNRAARTVSRSVSQARRRRARRHDAISASTRPRRRTVGAGSQVSSVVAPWAKHQSPNPSSTPSAAKRSSKVEVGGELVDGCRRARVGEAIAAADRRGTVVRLLRTPDDADLGGVGARAAVRQPVMLIVIAWPRYVSASSFSSSSITVGRTRSASPAPARTSQRRAGDRQPSQRAHLVGQRDIVSRSIVSSASRSFTPHSNRSWRE